VQASSRRPLELSRWAKSWNGRIARSISGGDVSTILLIPVSICAPLLRVTGLRGASQPPHGLLCTPGSGPSRWPGSVQRLTDVRHRLVCSHGTTVQSRRHSLSPVAPADQIVALELSRSQSSGAAAGGPSGYHRARRQSPVIASGREPDQSSRAGVSRRGDPAGHATKVAARQTVAAPRV
jgi:hypothetical protein